MDKPLPQVDYLLVDLIASCNLRCLHCRAAAGFDNQTELSLEKFKEILEDAKELGVKTITLSGGEPFLKKDIFITKLLFLFLNLIHKVFYIHKLNLQVK